jgi:cytochrome c-type biogenesis protein CcmH
MILPSLLICLAIAALLPLVLPLLRPARAARERGHFDRAVYKDQLQELSRDVARGLLSEAEAVAARLEIQRRLLATETAPGPVGREGSGRSPVLASVVTVFIAGGATALYAWLGAPGIPDTPITSPAAAADRDDKAADGPGSEHDDLPRAVERLAEKLKADPSNADRWLLYAKASGSLRHWVLAAGAYRHAIALGRDGADVQAGLGEMLTMQADGTVTPAAHDAFVAALKLDPKQDVARYYLALAAGQAGEPESAIGLLQGLLADIPEDSPMRQEIGKRVGEAAKAAGLPVPELAKGTPAEAENPDEQALDAAAVMPDGEQKTMIAGMVAKLAAKLAADPDDADGWMRLGRAYAVLHESDKAADAYDHAAALKPGDAAIRLQAVDGLLQGLKPSDALPPRAVVLLRQVEVIDPDGPEVLWYLGIAAARDARPDDAKRYWMRLLAKLPSGGEDAKMVKTAMESLKER